MSNGSEMARQAACLADNAAELAPQLVEFLELGRRMRKHQAAFFKTRRREDMSLAQIAERSFDKQAAEILARLKSY